MDRGPYLLALCIFSAVSAGAQRNSDLRDKLQATPLLKPVLNFISLSLAAPENPGDLGVGPWVGKEGVNNM